MDKTVVDNKVILITGCGSLAKALAKHMMLYAKPKKIILFSRDEFLQHISKDELSDPRGILRFFIGDVRDLSRLQLACRDADIVIHTAALKRIEVAEYNPLETVKTNVDGTQNVIRACIDSHVERAVFISTDKAVMPVNLYGCTKAVAEKLWLNANAYKPIFNAVRYGNVMGSRGSLLPKYEKIAQERGVFPLTDERMTRFWVEMDEAVGLVMTALGGDPEKVYVLNSPTFRIVDLAKALYARAKFEIIGNRGSEKLHEMLVSEWDEHVVGAEAPLTSDMNNMSIAEIREKLKGGAI